MSKLDKPFSNKKIVKETFIGGSQTLNVNKNEDMTTKPLETCMNKVITRVKNIEHIKGLNLRFKLCNFKIFKCYTDTCRISLY